MIRISAVSYLNTAPFIYGITRSGFLNPDEYILQRDIPSVCASRLLSGEADIGIVPVAVIPRLPNFQILGNTCIGAGDHIDSVMLFSHVPLNEIREIMLDWQSNTSVNLCRVLAGEHWKIYPEWISAEGDYIDKIQGNTAAVVIGDRALAHSEKFPYRYDLAQEWHHYTGLPFVFACWVAAPNVPADFMNRLDQALQFGIQHRDLVVELEESRYPANYQVKKYLLETVSYTLDSPKLKALETFLSLSGKLKQYTPA